LRKEVLLRDIGTKRNQTRYIIQGLHDQRFDKRGWVSQGPRIQVKKQSRRPNKGVLCLILHVNCLPKGGSSTRHRALIAEFNMSISDTSTPGLFLSDGFLRLKSPSTNQSTVGA
jgi:hypothetical protein